MERYKEAIIVVSAGSSKKMAKLIDDNRHLGVVRSDHIDVGDMLEPCLMPNRAERRKRQWRP